MDEQERDEFIRKIGISAGDSDDTDEDDEEEDDPDHHKYNCKKCQVSFVPADHRDNLQTQTCAFKRSL